MAKPKPEASRSARKDASPSRTKKEPASTSRTYRKSPARTEKSKSPSRTAAKTSPSSPTRAPAGRSPARKSPSRKSPVRSSARTRTRAGSKSPSRAPKVAEPIEVEKLKPAGRPAINQTIEMDSDSDNTELARPNNIEKPKAAVRGRARRLDTDYTAPKSTIEKEPTPVEREISTYINLVRRSVQKSQSRESDRIVHLKHNDNAVQKLTEFSDEDEIPATRASSVTKSERYSEPKVIDKRALRIQLGTWIGVLLNIFIIPFVTLMMCIVCDQQQCSFTKLPKNLEKYKKFGTYINNRAIVIISSYALLLAVLSALPFGGAKVSGLPNKQGKLYYVMNGLCSTAVIGFIFISLEYFNVPLASYIIEHHFQLAVSSVIMACLFSVYLYIRSFFVPISALNPYAITNSRLYNFWVGREVNPRAFRILDLKMLLFRLFFIGMILLNTIFIYKNIQVVKSAEARHMFDIKTIDVNPTLLSIAALQIIYVLDFLVFESSCITTYAIQYEGVGYLTAIFGFTAPFLSISITKYVYDHQVKLPTWQLLVAILIFTIGYILYRGSNLQKHAFRQNPYSPALSHLESLPTSQGKKLLVSGYWGFVRHPNYLGDILMMLSFALFALNAPPSLFCYLDVIFLVDRARTISMRCKQRYGTAWDRYCQRVKYALIPKVY